MQETQEEQKPFHEDVHRTNLNLTLIFAMIVAVIGLYPAPNMLFLIGFGVAIYSWLSTPKRYQIYENALVIHYGRPRVKAYSFQEMSNIELLTLPIGDRLRIRMANGRRLMVLPKDSETFQVKLEEALNAFHNGQQGADYDQETQLGTAPQIDNGVQPDIGSEPHSHNGLGESSTENDDVPY